MSTTFIVEASIAERLGTATTALRVVPRRRRSRWGLRRGQWQELSPADALDTMVDAPATPIVLSRSAHADPGAAKLRSLAHLVNVDVLYLPDDVDDAAWSVAIATRLADADRPHLLRALGVVCCGPRAFVGVPTRPWGAAERLVPAVRPVTLARWASCAWESCAWCTGGGAPGDQCRRCGMMILAATIDGDAA